MRYYHVYLPCEDEPVITTRLRGLKNLPEGTRIEAIVTERDGSLADSWDIPIVDGRPDLKGRGKDAPGYHGL